MIFSVKAQSVSLSEATVAADRFLHSQSKSLSQCAHVETAGTDTLFYIFNAENGFVVIGGDWRVPPVWPILIINSIIIRMLYRLFGCGWITTNSR